MSNGVSTVIVPLDGSGFAEQALPVAIDIAGRTGARLHVIAAHASTTPARGGLGTGVFSQRLDAANRVDVERYIAETAARLSAAGAGIATTGAVLDAPAGKAIAEYAEANAPSLIVLTTHGRGGLQRWWLGSVTMDVARRAATPLLAIRVVEDASAHVATGRFSRVVIALDGSPASERSIGATLEWAGRDGVEYVLFHSVLRLHRLQSLVALEAEYERDLAQRLSEAETYLAEIAARPIFSGIPVTTVARVHGNDALSIAEYAVETRADLVAAGAHSRSAGERMFLGSVAEKLVRASSVPVLLVRAAEE